MRRRRSPKITKPNRSGDETEPVNPLFAGKPSSVLHKPVCPEGYIETLEILKVERYNQLVNNSQGDFGADPVLRFLFERRTSIMEKLEVSPTWFEEPGHSQYWVGRMEEDLKAFLSEKRMERKLQGPLP